MIYSKRHTGQSCCIKQIQKEGPLVSLLDPDNLLSDVLRGGPNATDGQENVVVQEVPEKQKRFTCSKQQ